MTLPRISMSPWALGLAIFLGVIAGAAVDEVDHSLGSMYDWAFPVATGRATQVSRDGDAVLIAIRVKRHRDCQVQRLVAYGKTPEGVQHMMQLARVDQEFAARNIPTGEEADIGVWRAWPVKGIEHVHVYGHYLCAGRSVGAKLAEVRL